MMKKGVLGAAAAALLVAASLASLATLATGSASPEEDHLQLQPSLAKLDKGVGLTINILYCYSCGYKKAFDDYTNLIHQQFPEIIVTGGNYNPPGINMYLSGFIGIAKMLLIASILSGYYMIPAREPAWFRWFKENKIYSCMMVFFLCNTIEGQLVSSGAFEISLNDIPVWSKLETGRIPQVSELFQIIQNTMQFMKDSVSNGYVK